MKIQISKNKWIETNLVSYIQVYRSIEVDDLGRILIRGIGVEMTIGDKKVEKIFGFDKIGGDIKLAQDALVQRTNEFLAHFDIQIQEFPE